MEKIKPRIWLVSEIYWPSETSTGFLLGQLVSSLNSSFEVVVVTAKGERNQSRIKNPSSNNRVREERIITLPISSSKSNFKRFLKGFFFSLISLVYVVLKKNKKERVLVVTNPVTNPLVFGFLLGGKTSLLCHDLFPLNLIGLDKRERFTYSILKNIYGAAYRRFRKIISLGDDMTAMITKNFKTKSITKITNWVTHSEKLSSFIKTESSKRIDILFAGNIGKAQGLLEVIDFLESCGLTNVTLDIVGDGVYRNDLLEQIECAKIKIRYLGEKSRMEIFEMFKVYNYGLVSLNPAMFGLGVPSKSYDILSTGTPILYIGPPDTEVYKMVLENSLGIVKNINEHGSLSEVELKANYSPRAIIDYVYSNHSLKYITKKYIGVLS